MRWCRGGRPDIGLYEAETDEVFSAIDDGRLKLLYMVAGTARVGFRRALLRRARCSLIAVVEAHCVSQWGHDFRPDYLRIGALRDALEVPLAAFTATADEETRAEIVTRLFNGTPQPRYCAGSTGRTSTSPLP